MRVLKGQHPSAVRCLVYSPDGRLLAVGDDASRIMLWELPEGEQRSALERHKGSVECLAFSPSGERIAAGMPDAVVIWDMRTRELIVEEPGHLGGTRGVSWHPDGNVLATCGWDREVRFWTPELKLRQRKGPHQLREAMMALSYMPDGEYLALAGSYGRLMLGEMGRPNAFAELKHDRALYSIACAADGSLVASGDNKGDIILWDTAGKTPTRTLRGHEWTVYGLAFTPDGERLVSGSADGTVRLWEVMTGRLVETFRWHDSWVNCVAVSPDGMTAAAGSADGSVVVWDLAE